MAAPRAAGRTSSLVGCGSEAVAPRRGGWTTVPFIIVTVTALTIAGGGWLNNLIVFLIQEFHVKNINAAQMNNVVLGGTSFFPVVGAIVADSFLGCFSVIWVSTIISVLGIALLLLTVTLDSLRPVCEIAASGICSNAPSKIQYTVLYASLTLASVGLGGSRFTLVTLGANQFSDPRQQATFFNWYFVFLYVSSVASSIGIVYIEDNVGWKWGYGISLGANVLGLVVFCLGRTLYYRVKPQGSPFSSLACVIVASFRKGKEGTSSQSMDYYYGNGGAKEMIDELPTNSLRFFNRAALKPKVDIQQNEMSNAKPWKQCTVQQVEDLKTLIKILPLWSSSFLLSASIGIQASLTVLQTLATDRHLSRHFQIPAGSMLVFSLLSSAIAIAFFDHVLWPTWNKLVGPTPTPLKQIGTGHVINIAGMAVSALVEWRRRAAPGPTSVLWLVPQLVIVGIGEALHFPGQVALYYQEFPDDLKNMATAMISIIIGVGFYLSTAVTDLVRRVTRWLPDDINDGRVDNVYWMLVMLGVLNLGYYLVCAWMYKYKNVQSGGGIRG